MTKKAFTLIELVISMVIIIIISTIVTIMFTGYLVWVRDANRITQVSNIRDWISLKLNAWEILKPEWSVEIQFNWEKKSYQWYFWPSLIKKIWYSMDWTDPKDNNYFTYTLSANWKYFQLMTLLEKEENFVNVWYEKVLLIDNNDRIPFIVWSKEIWIFFNEDVIPIHEYANSPLNIITWNTDTYNVLLRNDKIVSSSWSTLFAEIQNVIANYGDNIYSCSPEIYLYANYTIWNPTVSNTPWQNYSSASPCYFSCQNWFTWNLNKCEPDINSRTISCTWLVSNALWNTATQVNQVWDTNIWDFVPTNVWTYNTIPSTYLCRFKCLNNYWWNWTTCEPLTQNWMCTWLISNAEWNTVSSITQTWDWSSWTPNLNWQYSLVWSTNDCNFKCSLNYTYDWTSCLADSKNWNCIWNPNFSTWHQESITQTWNWNDWLPSINWQYSNTPITNECKFKCDINYTWNSTTSTCDADTQIVTCTGLPLNATTNTVSSITQTWDGTSFIPSSTFVNNTTSSITECRFKCDSWYTWNGTSCAISPMEQFKLVLISKCWILWTTFDTNFNSSTWVYTWDIDCSSAWLVNADLDKFTPLIRVTWFLNLNWNSLTNVSWLSSLKSVWTNLRLNNNNLTSISNLSLLNSVPNLYLNNNSLLSNLTWIQNITNLTYIDISNNALTNLSWISTFTSLTHIIANNNNINDITWLASLNNINTLNLSFNNISTITTLSWKTSIKDLYLNNNSLSDISSLSWLATNLLYIYWNSSITNLSALNWYTSISKILALDDKDYTTKVSALSTVCINWTIKNDSLSEFLDITKVCKNPSWSFTNFEWDQLWLWYIWSWTNKNWSWDWWYFGSWYTPSNYTWPSASYDWNKYLFIETSYNNKWYSNKTSYLYYNINDNSNFVNFYYHAYWADIWKMKLQTYDWISRQTEYTIDWQKQTSYTKAWEKTPDITIPPWTTEIRLFYTSWGNYQWDFAVDAITVWEK